MQCLPQITNEYASFLGKANDACPLSVVIIYNDMHATLRAAQTLDRLGDKFNGRLRQHVQPMRFNYMEDPACFDHALFDARVADMVIASFNGPGDLPAALKKWIKDYTTQPRKGHAAIVALLTSNERLDAPDSPRYQFLKKTAQAMGLDFFAPQDDPEEEIEMTGRLDVVG